MGGERCVKKVSSRNHEYPKMKSISESSKMGEGGREGERMRWKAKKGVFQGKERDEEGVIHSLFPAKINVKDIYEQGHHHHQCRRCLLWMQTWCSSPERMVTVRRGGREL